MPGFLDQLWNIWVNGLYGCGSGIMRAVGQNAWSRYILAARALSVIHTQSALLQNTIEETQTKLKIMTDELAVHQAMLDSAIHDVREMAENRIEEKRIHAERMGTTFVFNRSEVLVWMNDYSEIRRIEELRVLKMQCRRLELRVTKLHAAKIQLQTTQAAFGDMICNAELAEDFERITERLDETNTTHLDPLIHDMMMKVYNITDVMQESAEKNREMVAEMDQMLESMPDRVKPGVEETKDIIELVFQTTEAPVLRRRAAKAEAVLV